MDAEHRAVEIPIPPAADASAAAARFRAVEAKVEAGERLTRDDGLVLERHPDLLAVGRLANVVRERKNGDFAYYNINVHLNPTNVCVYRCNFCAFRADLKSDKAYLFTDEQIVERAREAGRRGATEMHIVGGLHHKQPYTWYKRVLELVHAERPELHLKAYTPVEWDWFSRISGKPTKELIAEFRDAGLGSLPGGGAEIFDPVVREQICEHKADGSTWLRVHREAHELGLHSNATMLYGHLESAENRIDHLLALRDLQDQTGGFQTLIPLAFHPDNTGMAHLPKPSILQDLRAIAVSRLMLDNFAHIKAYWIMLGVETAQVALSYGADDLDGTVVHEIIYHDAGAETPQALSVVEIRRLIEEAGRAPVERDTLYRKVERETVDGGAWKLGDRILAAV
ncbi:MAG: aminofutalosine synthase MqnE [Planctomycetia bacterium]